MSSSNETLEREHGGGPIGRILEDLRVSGRLPVMVVDEVPGGAEHEAGEVVGFAEPAGPKRFDNGEDGLLRDVRRGVRAMQPHGREQPHALMEQVGQLRLGCTVSLPDPAGQAGPAGGIVLSCRFLPDRPSGLAFPEEGHNVGVYTRGPVLVTGDGAFQPVFKLATLEFQGDRELAVQTRNPSSVPLIRPEWRNDT
jgi:hypothetical protein